MKKIITTISFCIAIQIVNAQTEFGQEMADILENMKKYTVAVAEAMPEDKFDFKPVPEVRTFKQQLDHIGKILEFQTNYPMQAKAINPETWPEKRKEIFGIPPAESKAEMISFLNQRFDAAIALFKTLEEEDYQKEFTFFFFPGKPEKDISVVAMALRDHITHHRAQAIVYLRLNGIEPPFYKLF